MGEDRRAAGQGVVLALEDEQDRALAADTAASGAVEGTHDGGRVGRVAQEGFLANGKPGEVERVEPGARSAGGHHVGLPALDGPRGLLQSHAGSCATWLHLKIPMRSETVLELGHGFQVAPTDEFLMRVERLFGDRVAVLR